MNYIEICALLHMNRIYTKFPGLLLQTPVVCGIIKALWTEEYDELAKMENNDKDYEPRPQSHHH